MSQVNYQIYMAGDLFNYKSLAGNQYLAEAIETVSSGRFKALLPQSIEMPSNRAQDIRNADYAALISCDLLIAQFDGTELDSGTVAEFMVAKQLDIPTVLFRSDFRKSGDQEIGGDAWNLMLSHFPRTEALAINAMAVYHETETLIHYFNTLAERLVEKLESVLAEKRLLAISASEQLEYHKQSLLRLGMKDFYSDQDLERLVRSKVEKGLL